jgi:hypothetical protein
VASRRLGAGMAGDDAEEERQPPGPSRAQWSLT